MFSFKRSSRGSYTLNNMIFLLAMDCRKSLLPSESWMTDSRLLYLGP